MGVRTVFLNRSDPDFYKKKRAIEEANAEVEHKVSTTFLLVCAVLATLAIAGLAAILAEQGYLPRHLLGMPVGLVAGAGAFLVMCIAALLVSLGHRN